MITADASRFRALEKLLEDKRFMVDTALRQVMPVGDTPAVARAMQDLLFAPAKRVRPVLTLLVTEILKGDPESVLPAACAVEFVHTASLALDDLPCMDNASTRRGRPACHVGHGEATALLAAFALLNHAYEILAGGWPGAPEAAVRNHLAGDLARAVGLGGMIAGQSADLAWTDKTIDFTMLEFIHSRKTGALFTAAAGLGARAARADEHELKMIQVYAKNLGLAFQVVDDLIDVTAKAGDAGKDVRQDLKKTTFVSFSGVAGAWLLAEELAAASQEALGGFGPRAEPLRELARYVVTRRG